MTAPGTIWTRRPHEMPLNDPMLDTLNAASAGNSLADQLLFYMDHPVEWIEDMLNVVPDPWQQEMLREFVTNRYIAIRSGHGVGKLHPYNSEVPTPKGIRQWGDLQVGDELFDSKGQITTITQLHHYTQVPIYRVTFDDRSYCDVSSGHLWNVRGRQERRKGLSTWRTLETQEILELGVKRSNGTSQARQWEIPIQGAVEFEAREIDLHPYFVGIWLGDGHKSQPRYTKPYSEIAEKIQSLGYDVSHQHDGAMYVRGISHLLTDPVFQLNSCDRYIPDSYKFNTVENRMALFQGLCDSDGEVLKSGSIGFGSTSKQLAEDMIWLARSLGFKAMMQETVKSGWYPDKDGNRVECKDCYRVTINSPINPFTLKHRKQAYKPSEDRYTKRWIDSIEPIGLADGMCVTVANPDGLYQGSNFTVTHNSAGLSFLILWFLCNRPNCKIIATAPSKEQLFDVLWAELAQWIRKSNQLRSILEWSKDRIAHKSNPAEWWATARTSEVKKIGKDGFSVAEGLQGRHAESLLFVLDEASGIDEGIISTVYGALTTPDTYVVMTGNPTRVTGFFYDAFHSHRHLWKTLHVNCEDTPRVERDWIKRMLELYGSREHPLYRIRVRGEFPPAAHNSVFPLDIINSAQASPLEANRYDQVEIGVDVARYGGDFTVIAVRQGPQITAIHRFPHLSTMETAGKVQRFILEHQPLVVRIDAVGVGGGVVDRLKELGFANILAFNGGSQPSTEAKKKDYMNLRAEVHWHLRELMEQGRIRLPKDEELAAQMTTITYKHTSTGKMQIESKEELRARGVKSPDKLDAVLLATAPVYKAPKRATFATFRSVMAR